MVQKKKTEQQKAYTKGDKVFILEKALVEKDGKWIDVTKRKKGHIVEVEAESAKKFMEDGFLTVKAGSKVVYAKPENLEVRKNGNKVEKWANKILAKLSSEETQQLIEKLSVS